MTDENEVTFVTEEKFKTLVGAAKMLNEICKSMNDSILKLELNVQTLEAKVAELQRGYVKK